MKGHLVLTRNIGQSIVIGENQEVVINVLEVNGQQVRIGVAAPKFIPVHRSEVYDRIISERSHAALQK